MEQILDYLIKHDKVDVAVAYILIIVLFKLVRRCYKNYTELLEHLAANGHITKQYAARKKPVERTTPEGVSIPRPQRHAERYID